MSKVIRFGAGTLITLGLVLSGALAASAVPSSAEERPEGLWYVDRLKIDELQQQGATGKGITIAVVDVGVNPDVAELSGADVTVKGSYCANPETGAEVPAVSTDVSRAGHGTDVVAMLVGNGKAADGGLGTRGIVPEAEIWFYATGLPEEASTGEQPGCEKFNGATQQFYDNDLLMDSPDYFLGGPAGYAAWNAVRDGADIVVYSGISNDVYGWSSALTLALRKGVPLIAGTPNPEGNVENQVSLSFPFSLNGAVAVSGVDNAGDILTGGGSRTSPLNGEARGSENLAFLSAASGLLVPSGNSGWEATLGYGTSLATPLVAGTLAIGMQQNPNATANQVLQAMIRTTGSDGLHEPVWGGRSEGYGIANPLALLGADPQQFPDENPLFVTALEDPRCLDDPGGETPTSFDQCRWAASPTITDIWPAGQTDTPEPETGGGTPPSMNSFVIVGGIIALIVVASAIFVPLALSRSRKRTQQQAQPGPSESETTHG